MRLSHTTQILPVRIISEDEQNFIKITKLMHLLPPAVNAARSTAVFGSHPPKSIQWNPNAVDDTRIIESLINLVPPVLCGMNQGIKALFLYNSIHMQCLYGPPIYYPNFAMHRCDSNPSFKPKWTSADELFSSKQTCCEEFSYRFKRVWSSVSSRIII